MEVELKDTIIDANTGADAIQRAPIVDYNTRRKCLRIGDISNQRKYNEWGYTEVNEENYKKYKLEKEDILIARTGSTIGINTFIEKDYKSVYNNGLIRLRIDKLKYNSKFIYYVIQTNKFKNYINGIAFGTTGQPNMKINDLLKFKFHYIPLEIQNKIVKVLDNLDKKIELNSQINDNLLEIINCLYKDTFDSIENFDKAENIANITIGKTPPRSEKKCFTNNENDMKWISISDLRKSGTYIFNTAERLTMDSVDKYNVKIIPKNTIILSFKLTVGRIAITTENMATNEAIAHLNLKNEDMKYYLYSYLKNFDYTKLGSTSSIATAVNSKIIKAMPIGIPSEEVLKEYNNKVQTMFEKILENEKEKQNLEQLRDTLLPKLMNGEINLDKIEI